MDIAVAGATGTIGAEVVRVAAARGHGVRALSRLGGIDVLEGRGLESALRGSDAVVDVLSISTLSASKSIEFFEKTTAQLLDAERRAHIGHHLALSIVGVDRAPYDYYAGKVAQELAVEAGGVPWTILRATQFHDFAVQMFHRMAFGPVHPVITAHVQPIATTELAERIIDLVERGPSGRATDLAGPRREELGAMMRAWARHTGRRAWMPRILLPGAFGAALRDGAVLPGVAADRGRVTFEHWLQQQPTG